jgi:hypothetical protein
MKKVVAADREATAYYRFQVLVQRGAEECNVWKPEGPVVPRAGVFQNLPLGFQRLLVCFMSPYQL